MDSSQVARRVRQLQVGLSLMAFVWLGGVGWSDFLHQNWLFAILEIVVASIALVMGVLIGLNRPTLPPVRTLAMAAASLFFLVVLWDDVAHVEFLTTYTYLDAAILISLSFALLEVNAAVFVTVVVNLALLVGVIFTPVRDFGLLGAEVFLSALTAYATLLSVRVQQALAETEAANNEIYAMTARDRATGLLMASGLRVHLNRRWADMDDYQRGYIAVIMLGVYQYPQLVQQLGAEAGSHILQKLAVILIQSSDLKDEVARGEGGTFLLLLNNVKQGDVKARLSVLDRLLKGPLWLGGPVIELRSGWAMLGEADTVDTVLTLAEQRYAAAKEQGRVLHLAH